MLERALNRIMLVVIASRFPETEKPLPLKTEKCHNIGCLYSISGFLMALTAALKAQIAAYYVGGYCEPLSRNRKTITPENRKMPQYWLFIQYFRFSHGINRRA